MTASEILEDALACKMISYRDHWVHGNIMLLCAGLAVDRVGALPVGVLLDVVLGAGNEALGLHEVARAVPARELLAPIGALLARLRIVVGAAEGDPELVLVLAGVLVGHDLRPAGGATCRKPGRIDELIILIFYG
jgi:hypothetical protein